MVRNLSQMLEQARQYMTAGRPAEAENLYRQILSAQPHNATALHMLGRLAHLGRRPDVAIDLITKAIAMDPVNADAQLDLGATLMALNRPDEAIEAFTAALALSPTNPQAHYALGTVLISRGKNDAGIKSLQQALALRPDYAEAHNNLGHAMISKGRLDQAIAYFEKCQELSPSSPEGPRNLGGALASAGQFERALEVLGKVVARWPNDPDAHCHLASAFKGIGQIDQAIGCYDRALKVRPSYVGATNNRLYNLHFSDKFDGSRILKEHQAVSDLLAKSIDPARPAHDNERSPGRRLKIGYVSPDFREHSVAFFFEGLLTHHAAAEVETFCYVDLHRPDEISSRLQRAAHHWRDITCISDAQVAQMIRRDRIDLLVDLAGFTAGGRPALLAGKPAPIQINYLGYPHTSGLSAIDYRLTDVHLDPPGMTEPFHSEELLRLPETFACFRPPNTAPDVSPLPSLSNKHVTFASFATLAKVTPALLDAWASLLNQLPSSRLLLMAKGLQDALVQRSITVEFEARGISPDRLDLVRQQSMKQYLAMHNSADIVLDTFPVNGHTTTCHALWMGLPTVCLSGEASYQRFSVSVLHNLGLQEFISQTPQQYVEIALRLAQDLPRLAELRMTMRQRMTQSPLLDGARLARNVESVYRSIWQRWCRE